MSSFDHLLRQYRITQLDTTIDGEDITWLYVCDVATHEAVGNLRASFTPGGVVYLSDIHVVPGHRQKGLCSWMLSIIQRQPNVKVLSLDVEPGNLVAIKAYKRNGFFHCLTFDDNKMLMTKPVLEY